MLPKVLMDLHTHTLASGHAYSTLKENIDAAKACGLKVLGTSDHYQVLPDKTIPYFFTNYKVLTPFVNGIRLIRGVEVDIIDYDGNLDIAEKDKRHLDYIIVSLHQQSLSPGNKKQNTEALLGAMRHERVKIMGHLNDGIYPINMQKVVQVAADRGILLELNNASLRPNAGRIDPKHNALEMLKWCKQYQARVVLSSDSHIYYDIGCVEESEKLLLLAEFPLALVMNYALDRLEWLGVNSEDY